LIERIDPAATAGEGGAGASLAGIAGPAARHLPPHVIELEPGEALRPRPCQRRLVLRLFMLLLRKLLLLARLAFCGAARRQVPQRLCHHRVLAGEPRKQPAPQEE
jgi:hypothetical protein